MTSRCEITHKIPLTFSSEGGETECFLVSQLLANLHSLYATNRLVSFVSLDCESAASTAGPLFQCSRSVHPLSSRAMGSRVAESLQRGCAPMFSHGLNANFLKQEGTLDGIGLWSQFENEIRKVVKQKKTEVWVCSGSVFKALSTLTSLTPAKTRFPDPCADFSRL